MFFTKDLLFFLNNPYSLTSYFGFGTPGNDKMLSIVLLYVEMMSILLAIVLVIAFVICYSVFRFHGMKNRAPIHFSANAESVLDTVFALIPTVIITYLLIPALGFLFQVEYDENFLETLFNVYVIGHQWYWTYEIDTKLGSDILVDFYDSSFVFPVLQFDSYMAQEGDVNRLLDVDKSLVLPSGYNICLYVTSHDVIHSWSVPQLGIKVDAIPGRLMKYILYASMEGVYYGQCSELCGVNHAFMPICVEIVKNSYFIDWLFLSLDCNIVQTIDSSFVQELNYLGRNDIMYVTGGLRSPSKGDYFDDLTRFFSETTKGREWVVKSTSDSSQRTLSDSVFFCDWSDSDRTEWSKEFEKLLVAEMRNRLGFDTVPGWGDNSIGVQKGLSADAKYKCRDLTVAYVTAMDMDHSYPPVPKNLGEELSVVESEKMILLSKFFRAFVYEDMSAFRELYEKGLVKFSEDGFLLIDENQDDKCKKFGYDVSGFVSSETNSRKD